jgi:hypothetical protein
MAALFSIILLETFFDVMGLAEEIFRPVTLLILLLAEEAINLMPNIQMELLSFALTLK